MCSLSDYTRRASCNFWPVSQCSGIENQCCDDIHLRIFLVRCALGHAVCILWGVISIAYQSKRDITGRGRNQSCEHRVFDCCADCIRVRYHVILLSAMFCWPLSNDRNIGWKYYLVFIILSGVSAVIIFFLWPDTKGMPLEQIAALFGVSLNCEFVSIYHKWWLTFQSSRTTMRFLTQKIHS